MASSYPAAPDAFESKQDGAGHYVYASYFNDLQNAISAVQATLGVNPQGTHSDVAAAIAAAALSGGGTGGGASLTDIFKGTWSDVATYNPGDLAYHRGAAWIASAMNAKSEPGGAWGMNDYTIIGGTTGAQDEVWTDLCALAFQVDTDTDIQVIDILGAPPFVALAADFDANPDPEQGAPILASAGATPAGIWSRAEFFAPIHLTANTTYRVVFAAGANWTSTAPTTFGHVSMVGNIVAGDNFETTYTDRHTAFRLHEVSASPWTLFAGQPTHERRITYDAGTVPANGSSTFDVALGQAWRLMEIWVDQPARVRIYDTDDHRTNDRARPYATPLDATANHGCYLDINLTASNQYRVLYPPVHGSNRDGMPSDTTYVTVDNPRTSNQQIFVTFFYVTTATSL